LTKPGYLARVLINLKQLIRALLVRYPI
jgi:hypothetical protein